MDGQRIRNISLWLAWLRNVPRVLCYKRYVMPAVLLTSFVLAILNIRSSYRMPQHEIFVAEPVENFHMDTKPSMDIKGTYPVISEGQEQIDYIATFIDLKYKVLSNLNRRLDQRITLTNKGSRTLGGGTWCIYYHIMYDRDANPRAPSQGLLLGNSGFRVYNIRGHLRCLGPDNSSYVPIRPRETRIILYNVADLKSTRSDIFPNWYVTSGNLTPKILECVKRLNEDFVEPFSSPEQYKQRLSDPIGPLTAESRYNNNKKNLKFYRTRGSDIIPTPLVMNVNEERTMLFNSSEWRIRSMGMFLNEATFLSEMISVPVSTVVQGFKIIDLILSYTNGVGREGYVLRIDTLNQQIIIEAEEAAGAFYAVQSLLSILSNGLFLPNIYIRDMPRFSHRGLNCDVGHNFIPKQEIIKYIDAMAMYKMNKLHLHLTEDDGWRIQIPGLEELTTFGSQRCHDESETRCLMPQYGSGPYNTTSGSGFYTVTEYQEILRYAERRHIQIIPEIDTPGHSRAAIKSMQLRHKYSAHAQTDFTLRDKNDKSQDKPNEVFTDNTMDICLNSTYTFIEHVFKAIKAMHEDIQPLKLFHIGGDEVSVNSWTMSPACEKIRQLWSKVDIRKNFLRRVTDIVTRENVNIAAWDDIVMTKNSVSELNDLINPNTSDFFVYPWKHMQTTASRSNTMATKGYKVVLSMADFLYLDQKYEADPYEPGLYWASESLGTKVPFSFIPENLYANIERSGIKKMTNWLVNLIWGAKPKSTRKPVPPLENIAGMECHLWSETITSPQLHQYLGFPRMLAVAERAWHKAAWEDISDSNERDKIRDNDWSKFANIVGKKELKRLDKMGIGYRISPPGAIIENDVILRVNSEFPGLKQEYRTGHHAKWTPITQDKAVINRKNKQEVVYVRSVSTDGLRKSRVMSLT